MEVLVLDTNFIAVDIVDSFDSLIWADRYSKVGDFEILTPVDGAFLTVLQPDYYLWMNGSDHVMIVEGRQIATDPEEGNHLVFTGRSLESILDRRIIWVQTILTGNFQNGILKLLNENAISPTDSARIIPNLIFEASTDPRITVLTVDAQFTGDNLYDSICSLCEEKGIGFKITLTDDNKFKFKLYAGEDRSYDQIANPYIEFSPNFDNLLNSNYAETKKALKTITLVAGEGEGSARKTTTVAAASGAGMGLARREMFTDARDISSTIDGGTLTTEQYNTQLAQRGSEKLAENVLVSSFEGQADTETTYKYGEDFFMGDVLQLVNEYGMKAKTRVVELIRSQSTAGEETYPTFAQDFSESTLSRLVFSGNNTVEAKNGGTFSFASGETVIFEKMDYGANNKSAVITSASASKLVFPDGTFTDGVSFKGSIKSANVLEKGFLKPAGELSLSAGVTVDSNGYMSASASGAYKNAFILGKVGVRANGIIKPNTIYSLVFDIPVNTLNTVFILSQATAASDWIYGNYSIPLGQIGRFKKVVTSKSVITSEMFLLRSFVDIVSTSGSISFKVGIFEGDVDPNISLAGTDLKYTV